MPWYQLLLTLFALPVVVALSVAAFKVTGTMVATRWRMGGERKLRLAIEAVLAETEQRLQAELADHDGKLDDIATRLARMETDQFGGNHGGLREQVDRIGATLADQGRTVSGLSGRLDVILTLLGHEITPTSLAPVIDAAVAPNGALPSRVKGQR